MNSPETHLCNIQEGTHVGTKTFYKPPLWNTEAFQGRNHKFKSHLYFLLDMWPWGTYLFYVRLSFLIQSGGHYSAVTPEHCGEEESEERAWRSRQSAWKGAGRYYQPCNCCLYLNTYFTTESTSVKKTFPKCGAQRDSSVPFQCCTRTFSTGPPKGGWVPCSEQRNSACSLCVVSNYCHAIMTPTVSLLVVITVPQQLELISEI